MNSNARARALSRSLALSQHPQDLARALGRLCLHPGATIEFEPFITNSLRCNGIQCCKPSQCQHSERKYRAIIKQGYQRKYIECFGVAHYAPACSVVSSCDTALTRAPSLFLTQREKLNRRSRSCPRRHSSGSDRRWIPERERERIQLIHDIVHRPTCSLSLFLTQTQASILQQQRAWMDTSTAPSISMTKNSA